MLDEQNKKYADYPCRRPARMPGKPGGSSQGEPCSHVNCTAAGHEAFQN